MLWPRPAMPITPFDLDLAARLHAPHAVDAFREVHGDTEVTLVARRMRIREWEAAPRELHRRCHTPALGQRIDRRIGQEQLHNEALRLNGALAVGTDDKFLRYLHETARLQDAMALDLHHT